MRIFEIEDKPKGGKMPHLYLDMDGVQADFFGHWAKEHGVEHYKAIPHPEAAIEELAHSNDKRVYKFFHELDPLPGGQQIINWIKTNHIPFTVLSAPLRGPYEAASIKGKKDWLDTYNPGTSKDAIFTSEKYRYALDDNGNPNVLVDDYGIYINKWKNAGGIPVKHEDGDTGSTITALEKIYGPYLNKGKENLTK